MATPKGRGGKKKKKKIVVTRTVLQRCIVPKSGHVSFPLGLSFELYLWLGLFSSLCYPSSWLCTIVFPEDSLDEQVLVAFSLMPLSIWEKYCGTNRWTDHRHTWSSGDQYLLLADSSKYDICLICNIYNMTCSRKSWISQHTVMYSICVELTDQGFTTCLALFF